MGHKTSLYDEHIAAGAKLADFAGWDMPINYGSQISEHKTVRDAAGMFDVSHMRPVDIQGPQARAFLRYIFANDVARIDETGRALYTCMLNDKGGIIDDLIVYHWADQAYRIVANAANAAKDIAWLEHQARAWNVQINVRHDLAIIAVQGPQARELTQPALPAELSLIAMQLKPFRVAVTDDWAVGRTGYTGEDGFEIMLPAWQAVQTWRALHEQGVAPIGLGARDTLRLEAGLNLYGQDMDEATIPHDAGLGWTVVFEPEERDFIGRTALEPVRQQGSGWKLIGLILEERGMIRSGMRVRRADDARAEGVITSGSFAPTLQRSIALARVPAQWNCQHLALEMRGKWVSARVVSYPFVRHGKICVE